MPTTPEFVDLFDIEKRPGAGLELWTFALEMQLQRVRDANFRHRLAQSFNVGAAACSGPGVDV